MSLIAARYRLGETLGVGGMGRVWLARDEVLERDVAVKEVLLPDELLDRDRDAAHRRTLREARASARLSHPNVVQVYDVLDVDGRAWIVMEYVPSRSLHEVLRQDGPLDPRRVARIGLDLVAALRAAHRAGVDHRDVKPANVLLADDGRVLLTDFGIARIEGDALISSSDMLLGSPEYMSPERARDGTAGLASDLWSLGATLYAAVEGQSPFHRASAIASLTALAADDPDPPRQAGPLEPVLNGLLHKDPADRLGVDEAEHLLRTAAAGAYGHALVPARSEAATTEHLRPPADAKPAPAREEPVAATPAPAREEAAVSAPVREESAVSASVREEAAVSAPVREDAVGAPSPEAGPAEAVSAPPSDVGSEPARNGATSPSGGDPAPAYRAAPSGGPVIPAQRSPWRGRPERLDAETRPSGSSPRRRIVAAGSVLAALLVAAVVWAVARSGSAGEGGPTRSQVLPASAPATPTAAATSAATPSANPSSAPSSAAASSGGQPSSAAPGSSRPVLPDGWRDYKDKTGFSVYVPEGWTRSREGSMVYFRSAGRVLGIDQTDTPQPDPKADWRGKADYRVSRGDFPSYREIRIDEVDYFRKAADWEFTFVRGGVRQHVNNRGVITSARQAYGFYWQTRDADWERYRSDLQLVFDSFRPAT